MSISAAICIYNDFDFIEDCIDRIYDYVDEIVILDGPYTYCEPILQEFDLLYKEAPEPLKHILSREKIKYSYSVFENEKEKRIALYEMCSCDIVMLLDSDELTIGVDQDAINEFLSSPMSVAPARIHNHVRSATLIKKDTRKFIFFKRNDVTAIDHLNYTWLVGVEQSKPNEEIMFRTPLMEIAHLTLMRSPFFNIVKYCFYTRLYFYSRNMMDDLTKLFGIPFEEVRSSGLDYKDVKEIFRRSIPALINFTSTAPLHYDPSALDNKYDDVIDSTSITETPEFFLLGRVNSYHYLNLPTHLLAGDVVHLSWQTDNVESLEVNIQIHNRMACETLSCEVEAIEGNVWTGRFTLPFDTSDLFGTLIHFKATTAQAKQVGRIKNFLIKKHVIAYGNCQTERLRDFLLSSKEFNRHFFFESTPGRLAHMMTPDDARKLHEIMHRVDYLITQPVNKSFRDDEVFSTDVLLEYVRGDARVFMMPNLFFTGYAPESYCVTYRKKFMQSPSPIHDINMIYSFVKHGGDRPKAKDDYRSKLRDENFYKPSMLADNIKKNLDELDRREKSARSQYSKSNIEHFSYSAFLAEHYDKALTHYSDAHPSEYVFTKLAEIVLAEMGIDNDLAPPPLGEKGMVPLYESVGRYLGFDAVAQPIFVNNRQVSFDEFCKLYFDAYDKIESDELVGYIFNHVTRVVVANHKTDSARMFEIFSEYCQKFNLKFLDLNAHLAANDDAIDTALDFQSYDFIFITRGQHFEQLIQAVPYLRYRAIQLIRNPFEIIMSGVRDHQVTDESWCLKKLFVADSDGFCGFRQIAPYDVGPEKQLGEYSYQDIMNMLPAREKVEFEIRNHSSALGTIPGILGLLSFFRDDRNVSTVHSEDIASPESIAHVFKFLSLREEFLDAYTAKVGGKEWLGKHVTNLDGGATYLDSFDQKLFQLFEQEFGPDTLGKFGYAPNAQHSQPMKAENVYPQSVIEDAFERKRADKTASDLFAEGDKLLSERKIQEAKALFLQSLELSPRDFGTLGRLGDVCVRLGQHEEAIGFYKRIEALPISKPVWLYIGLANAYESLKQREAAAGYLRMALSLGGARGGLSERLAALEGV